MSVVVDARRLGEMLLEGCAALSVDEIARASILGKRESLFRDILINQFARRHPDHLAQAEWKIPDSAMDRFRATRFAGDNSKAIVDFVAVPHLDPLTTVPTVSVEFKLWYWFDAVTEKKYETPDGSNHHQISASFVADAEKLRAVSPITETGRLIVTVVPTFHHDQLSFEDSTAARRFLKDSGFPYSSPKYVVPTERYVDVQSIREAGLARLTDYFSSTGCPTILGRPTSGKFAGMNVTTDFVISEIPPLHTPLTP
jgi:hypothetical protein